MRKKMLVTQDGKLVFFFQSIRSGIFGTPQIRPPGIWQDGSRGDPKRLVAGGKWHQEILAIIDGIYKDTYGIRIIL